MKKSPMQTKKRLIYAKSRFLDECFHQAFGGIILLCSFHYGTADKLWQKSKAVRSRSADKWEKQEKKTVVLSRDMKIA